MSPSASIPAPAAAPSGAADPARRILVFGDSLTWGWTPSSPITPTTRQPQADRWTGAMAAALGPGFEIIAEGLSGRTTDADDPVDPHRNGAAVFPALLASHAPLDLVILLLGTNDAKAHLERAPLQIGLGAGRLLAMTQDRRPWAWSDHPAPRALLICPPPLAERIDPAAQEEFRGGREKSLALPPIYAAIAAAAGAEFLDAGTLIETDGIDGIHLTAAANRTLGAAAAGKVRAIFAD